MSGKTPPPPPPPPPPVQSTGADKAQAELEAKRRERNRYDFSKTILRPGGLLPGPEGTKETLG
ncbi:hypothetical protein [Luteolibacter sp. LG18]|uniref:hypothetical protein n=1 Tax=Luteolibacter sp. LG18 TaxID=2819286 RepID=UPI002B283FEB|nr:hypothetical protein llg_26810 [Luteolibacter sp. LG18]